jgi:predicted 3-demethylubiquinone-9 3-methyltransferase (glyoxalase superfamily)
MKEKITPCLWYNSQAREAAKLYCDVFESAKITAQSPVVAAIEVRTKSHTVGWRANVQAESSISFFYICETEDELNRIWDAFIKEGVVLMPLNKYPWSEKYGWVSDKFGVSWQFSLGKFSDVGQKITPCLMFVGKQYGRAEEAIAHYSSVFKDVNIEGVRRYGKGEAPDA